jgi:hypothetical protein
LVGKIEQGVPCDECGEGIVGVSDFRHDGPQPKCPACGARVRRRRQPATPRQNAALRHAGIHYGPAIRAGDARVLLEPH